MASQSLFSQNADEGSDSDHQANEPDQSQGQDKKKIKFFEGEMSIILDTLEDKYETLFGHQKTNEYKRKRKRAWEKLTNAVNHWHVTEGTGKIRTQDTIKTKIDNLKSRSKYFTK